MLTMTCVNIIAKVNTILQDSALPLPVISIHQPRTINHLDKMDTSAKKGEIQTHDQQPVTGVPRTLHVYSQGMFRRGYRIVDSDKSTPLFTVGCHSWSKPNVRLYAMSGPQRATASEVGSAAFRTFSSSIDMIVGGHKIDLTRNGILSGGHQWQSPGLGGTLLKWKNDGPFSNNRICYVHDDKDNVVARWERSTMSMFKQGKLHVLAPSRAVPGASMLEELLVTAITEVEVARRRKNNTTRVGGGDGGY